MEESEVLKQIIHEKDREIEGWRTTVIKQEVELSEMTKRNIDLKEENERLRALLKEVRPVIMRVGSKTLIEIDTLLTETKKP